MDLMEKMLVGIMGVSMILLLLFIVALATGYIEIKKDKNTTTQCNYIIQPNGVIIPICYTTKNPTTKPK
jgi:hypothetical protein